MSLGPAYGVGTPSGIPGVDVDLFNDALVVIPELHHQIHEGVAFHISTANFGDWDSLGSGNEHYDVLLSLATTCATSGQRSWRGCRAGFACSRR